MTAGTLLCFGYGYSAHILARRLHGLGWEVRGTTRSAEKLEALRGKGVARKLFQHLIDAARERQLKVMTGITLRENTRMIDLSRSLGFAHRADTDEPELVRMTLAL